MFGTMFIFQQLALAEATNLVANLSTKSSVHSKLSATAGEKHIEQELSHTFIPNGEKPLESGDLEFCGKENKVLTDKQKRKDQESIRTSTSEQANGKYFNSNAEITNETNYSRGNTEDSELCLGAEADTMPRKEIYSTDNQEDNTHRISNIVDDTSSFREPAPSTALSTCSTVSTSQLVPSSGKLLLNDGYNHNNINYYR